MLVPNLGKATQIAASSSHVCAILSDKSLSCWGKDGFFGPIDYGTIPLQISGVSQVAKVAVGESNTCVIQVDNTVKCWGSNLFGQLGNGTTDNAATPVNVIGLPSGG
jgi:alpha-tubulin suppressor-like RCC1 family protein